jgi:choline dehydrogenase-like flavoprotein
MFIDLEEYSGNGEIETDVCIVGAGAAGITLALELENSPANICILESGTFDYDVDTQSLAEGSNEGLPYYALIASRLRFLGGTTNHWGGVCRPLDPLDFRHREHIPHSGWPITRATLDAYYERAHKYCKLGPYEYGEDYWANNQAPLIPSKGSDLETRIMLERPVRFGREYRKQLSAAQNLQIFLSANVIKIESASNGEQIKEIRARSLGGKSLRVSAKHFILAAGAIENARLLLSSTDVHSNGIGNQHDLVGRFFMEHPLFPSMEVQLSRRDLDLSLYTGIRQNELGITGYLAVNDDTLQAERMLNVGAALNIGGAEQPIAKSTKGVASAVSIWNSVKEGGVPPNFGEHVANLISDTDRVVTYTYERAFMRSPLKVNIVLQVEQAPNPSSRVTLGTDIDRLGMRNVNLDWQMGNLERHTVNRFSELLGIQLGRLGLGRARLLPADEAGWWTGMRGSWHHMGTTRMHDDPRQGVVNADCKIHGINNLYVAGSSVFTTSGFANPTLTIVALAARLANTISTLKS